MSVEHGVWEVHGAGYEWRTLPRAGLAGGGREPARVLVPRGLGEGPLTVRYYDPLEEPALWRRFVKVKQDEGGVQEFADRFGFLTNQLVGVALDPMGAAGGATGFRVGWGETLESWLKELESMRRASSVWDMIRTQGHNVDAIRARVKRPPGRKWVVLSDRDADPAAPFQDDGRWAEALPEESVRGDEPALVQAYRFVERRVNAGLAGRIDAMLLWHVAERREAVRLRPKSLAGALWYQFARAVANRTEFRECPVCGTPFALETRRAGPKVYCSNACKQRAHRERKTRAAGAG